MTIPELQQNPLVQRVISIFDADSNGEVDFKGIISSDVINNYKLSKLLKYIEFIEGISQFSVKGDKESKLKCM